jgi:AraC-like DNA-binding protein
MNYIDKNFANEVLIEPEFNVFRIFNTYNDNQAYVREIDRKYIQMYFGLSGDAKLIFNNGRYVIDIQKNKSLVLFNPQQNLPINIELAPKSKVLIVLISIKKFHSFFSEFAKYITFLNDENLGKKYYSSKDLTPSEEVVLNQIFNNKLHKSLEKLYLKGKVFELLSLYFNFNENDEVEKCPFLEDEENVNKIKKAKEIVINRMASPPSLPELAVEIGLSLKKLKDGFKHIYGETVFNFLIDYKLDYARKLLETKKYNVSEISDLIGYSTSSHFIAAFKKKFGTTPKKYLGKI